jgi:hypothetical protein
VWTALGLAIAFAVVSANSNTRRAVTAAPAAKATVANAVSADECPSSDVCCPRESKNAVVAAAKTHKAVSKKAVVTTPVTSGSAGAVIAIDPETGELGMPNAQQMQEIESRIAPIEGEATMTVMPDGALRLNLNGTAVEYATVHVDATGKKVFGCTSDKPVTPSQAPTLEEK